MSIQINILILNMVFDSIFVHFFLFQILIWVKNGIIFGVGKSSSVVIDKKKKNIIVLDEDQTQGLYDAMITAEAKYSITFSRSRKKM